MYQELHQKFSHVTEYDIIILPLFEDKQRASHFSIQLHIFHLGKAILTSIDTDIN
jgi:hypothetical protein